MKQSFITGNSGFFLMIMLAVSVLASCATTAIRTPERAPAVVDASFPVMGTGTAGEEDMVAFILKNNPSANRAKALRLARLYREEARIEAVNADVAFVQMCLETGFLQFGNLVAEDMNNFCGLGAIGPGQPGLRFPDERTGVRAHIQHLQAYASKARLVQESVDPRYRYVKPRGKAPKLGGLSGTWAADPLYGEKLAALLNRLYTLMMFN